MIRKLAAYAVVILIFAYWVARLVPSLRGPKYGAQLDIRLYDGQRKPVPSNAQLEIRINNSTGKMVFYQTTTGPQLMVHDLATQVFSDTYSVEQSGKIYAPVKIYLPVKPGDRKVVYLLVLPRARRYDFSHAQLADLQQSQPQLSLIMAQGAVEDTDAQARFKRLMDKDPEALACLFNIATALDNTKLAGGSALSYMHGLDWNYDGPTGMRRDHLFAWVDKALVEQLRRQEAKGSWQSELGFRHFHKGATASFKQRQFPRANLHVSFFENHHQAINGIDCIQIEVHIDYFRDLVDHTIHEVIPERFLNRTTDPAIVYQLRWMTEHNNGGHDFAPPYAIVPAN